MSNSPLKTVPGGLAAQVGQSAAQDRLTTWAMCYTLTRVDGTVFHYTDHDQPITVSGVTYQPALSFVRSDTCQTSDVKSDTSDIDGVLDSVAITETDMQAGRYDGATLQQFLVDWTSPSSGIIKWQTGFLGQVTRGQNSFKAEFNSLKHLLGTYYGRFYSPTCRNALGDAVCQFNLGGTTQDGNQATQSGTVTAVVDGRTFTASGLVGPGARLIKYNSVGYLTFSSHSGGGRFIQDTANGFATAGFKKFDPLSISGSAFNDAQHTIRSVTSVASPLYPGGIGLMNLEMGMIFEVVAGSICTLSTRTPGYFETGTIVWTSGNNNGLKQDVRTWDGVASANDVSVGVGTGVYTSAAVINFGQTGTTPVPTGLAPGDYIFASGYAHSANNGLHKVISAVGGVLTTDNTASVAESAGPTVGFMSSVSLLMPMPNPIQVGDTFTITTGCTKRMQDCTGKFNNMYGPSGTSGGFNGEDCIPGENTALTYI